MKSKKEVINYLFFGILATFVNIICFQLFNLLFGHQAYLINNILSWVITVAFAFVTNKLFVFKSKSWSMDIFKVEIIGFLSARIFSLILEEAGLFLMIDVMNFEKLKIDIFSIIITGSLIAKVIMQLVVVLTNYIFSKFFIFKNNK